MISPLAAPDFGSKVTLPLLILKVPWTACSTSASVHWILVWAGSRLTAICCAAAIAGNHSLGRRVAETRDQQPGVALLFLNRKRHKRKIEHRHAHQPEIAVVEFGGAVHIYHNAPPAE